MKNLSYIDKRGEISFYIGDNGIYFQQIGIGTPFKVDEPEVCKFLLIGSKKGYDIKFCTDGVNGYCILKGEELCYTKIWTLKEADQKVLSIKGD